jgi:hypothetical protein
VKPTLKDLLVAAFGDVVRGELPAGFDAADLVAAGARPDTLPPIEFVDLPAIEWDGAPQLAVPAPVAPMPAEAPRAQSAGDQGPVARAGGIADQHRALCARLERELARRAIEPGAADGWRSIANGHLVTVSIDDLAREIWFDLLSDGIGGARGQAISLGHVQDVLLALAQRKRHERRTTLIANLTGRPASADGAAALAAWVKAVTGRDDVKDVRVMAHWLWLVKRLALGLRAEWDLMPIVYGREQGSGKSTAVERLTAPVHELGTTINAATLTDERRFRQLHVMLIGRWEEMAGAAKAEIEALKHTVTTPEINYRELATHNMVVARRTMSFIGTSNHSVDAMISDTTGARRFYQLDALPKLDHQVVNAVAPEMIWQAVSEHDRAPIHDVIEVVRETQVGLVGRDAVSMWLDAETWDKITIRRVDGDDPIVVHPYDEAKGCEFEDLAARFKRWCNEVGQSGLGVKLLAQRLKQEGWTKSRPAAEPGKPRVVLYHKPRPPQSPPVGPGTEIAPNPPGGAPDSTRPKRQERLDAKPADGEDAFGDGGSLAF